MRFGRHGFRWQQRPRFRVGLVEPRQLAGSHSSSPSQVFLHYDQELGDMYIRPPRSRLSDLARLGRKRRPVIRWPLDSRDRFPRCVILSQRSLFRGCEKRVTSVFRIISGHARIRQRIDGFRARGGQDAFRHGTSQPHRICIAISEWMPSGEFSGGPWRSSISRRRQLDQVDTKRCDLGQGRVSGPCGQ
jgi:hypothetical protein